jgi:hypothetical protein
VRIKTPFLSPPDGIRRNWKLLQWPAAVVEHEPGIADLIAGARLVLPIRDLPRLASRASLS